MNIGELYAMCDNLNENTYIEIYTSRQKYEMLLTPYWMSLYCDLKEHHITANIITFKIDSVDNTVQILIAE